MTQMAHIIFLMVSIAFCFCCLVAKSCLTLLRPCELQPTNLLCPWDFPGKSTRVGCHFLLQGLNPCPLHWQTDSLPLSHLGSPCIALAYCKFQCPQESDSLMNASSWWNLFMLETVFPFQGPSALQISAMLGCKTNVFISSSSQTMLEKQAFV